jgi:hypothetical protein
MNLYVPSSEQGQLSQLIHITYQTTTLAQEIFVSQARMMEAIDGFSRRLDYLGNLIRPLTRSAVPAGPNQGRTMSDPE